jgi:hypothetical protein
MKRRSRWSRDVLPAPPDDPDAYARLARKRAWMSLYADFLSLVGYRRFESISLRYRKQILFNY